MVPPPGLQHSRSHIWERTLPFIDETRYILEGWPDCMMCAVRAGDCMSCAAHPQPFSLSALGRPDCMLIMCSAGGETAWNVQRSPCPNYYIYVLGKGGQNLGSPGHQGKGVSTAHPLAKPSVARRVKARLHPLGPRETLRA